MAATPVAAAISFISLVYLPSLWELLSPPLGSLWKGERKLYRSSSLNWLQHHCRKTLQVIPLIATLAGFNFFVHSLSHFGICRFYLLSACMTFMLPLALLFHALVPCTTSRGRPPTVTTLPAHFDDFYFLSIIILDIGLMTLFILYFLPVFRNHGRFIFWRIFLFLYFPIFFNIKQFIFFLKSLIKKIFLPIIQLFSLIVHPVSSSV